MFNEKILSLQKRNLEMKKLCILLFILGLSFGYAQAQTSDTVSNEKNKSYPKREIGFSVGMFPTVGFFVPPNTGWNQFEDPLNHTYKIYRDDEHYENMYHLGSYTFNYNYHFSSKNSFGISLSWVGKHIDTYWIYTYSNLFGPVIFADTVNGKGWKHYFTLQGNYRNTYYRKNKISLYWGIYGGITLCVRDEDILPKRTISNIMGGSTSPQANYLALALQFNAFGIEIGDIYVFNMELGFGTQGLVKTGFKYKF